MQPRVPGPGQIRTINLETWDPPRRSWTHRLNLAVALPIGALALMASTLTMRQPIASWGVLAVTGAVAGLYVAPAAIANMDSVRRRNMRRAAARLRRRVEAREGVSTPDTTPGRAVRSWRISGISASAWAVSHLDQGADAPPLATARTVQYSDGRSIRITAGRAFLV